MSSKAVHQHPGNPLPNGVRPPSPPPAPTAASSYKAGSKTRSSESCEDDMLCMYFIRHRLRYLYLQICTSFTPVYMYTQIYIYIYACLCRFRFVVGCFGGPGRGYPGIQGTPFSKQAPRRPHPHSKPTSRLTAAQDAGLGLLGYQQQASTKACNYCRGLKNYKYCGPRIVIELQRQIPQADPNMILAII